MALLIKSGRDKRHYSYFVSLFINTHRIKRELRWRPAEVQSCRRAFRVRSWCAPLRRRSTSSASSRGGRWGSGPGWRAAGSGGPWAASWTCSPGRSRGTKETRSPWSRPRGAPPPCLQRCFSFLVVNNMYKNLEKGELRKKNKKKLEDEEGRISEKQNELEQRNNKKKRNKIF